MTEKQAKEICVLYGFDPDKVGKAFVRVAGDYAEPVRAALEAAAKDLKPCMNDNIGNLKKLAAFLKNDKFGADPSERATCLIGVNKLLPNANWVEVEARFDGMELPDAVTEMLNTAKQWAPSNQAYLKDTPDKRLLVLLKGRVSMGIAGVAKTEIYELIHYFHDKKIDFNLLSDSPTNDRGKRLRNINRYRLAAPAMNAFAGIASWGPGDAADKSAETNVRNHLLKHVLDDDQQPGQKALEWAEEPQHWWTLLKIELTFGDVRRLLPAISKQVSNLFEPSAGDNAKLPLSKTRDFLNLARPPNMTKPFEDFICDRYLKAYQEFALKSAKNFLRGMVGCDKAYGHTVGIYMGAADNVFLFGRLDDAGTKLELSSSYVTPSLDSKFKSAEELWALSNK
jgi:hypothetical protein